MTKIVFMGTPNFAVPTLKSLFERFGSDILVVSQPDKVRGRGKVASPTPIKQFALEKDLTVKTPENKVALNELLDKWQPDLVVIIAYGMILPKAVTDGFLCVNLHGSLLPKYRGATPMQAALLNGDRETGVTLFKLTEKMDDGDVIDMARYPLTGSETLGELHDALAALSADVIMRQVDALLAGSVSLSSQDHSKATYCKKIDKADLCLDLAGDLLTVYRQIKAYSPFPGAYVLTAEGKRVKLLNADWVDGELRLTQVKPEGKAAMAYEDYLLAHAPLV